MLLEVLLGGGDELDGSELEAAVLEAGDDGADQAALESGRSVLLPLLQCRCELWVTYLNAVGLDGNEAVSPSSVSSSPPHRSIAPPTCPARGGNEGGVAAGGGEGLNVRLLGSHGGDGVVFGVLSMELVFRPRSMAQWQVG